MLEQVLDELKQMHARQAVLINTIERRLDGQDLVVPTSIVIKGGDTVEIPSDWINGWCKIYPTGFVMGVIRDAAAWSMDNPDKRKTRAGLRRFLGAWVLREANKLNISTLPVNDSLDKYERRY